LTSAQAGLLPAATESTVERIADTYGEPAWMRAARHAALRRALELPVESNLLFKTYVDLRAAHFDAIEPYLDTGDAADVADALPEGAAGLLAISEDRVTVRALSDSARAAGVVLDTTSHGLREHPELLPQVQAMVEQDDTLPIEDKFAQLARALSTVGVLVHVPAGVTLAAPLVIRWAAGAAGRGLLTRTLINLGRDAHATILEEQLPSGAAAAAGAATDGQSLWWGTSELALDDAATLKFAGQQNFGPDTLMFVNRQARLARDAQLRWSLASVGGQLQKSRIDNILEGRGAGVRQAEIVFGGGSQLFDLTSYTHHVGADTTGDLLSKGVFLDRSRGYFKGLIRIDHSARGTDSFLGEFSMLLDKKARSVAIPSLEIDQPDVRRAAHSSSVGPIDETQVFYLMSRGLPRELARKFIVLGFLEPVVARIPLLEAEERLRALLDAKWPTSPAEQSAA
jgi:Fe-S cluster assembly scaffold protein SufB